MKKKMMSLMAMCMLAGSMTMFAQDNMKQQDSKDQMQSGDKFCLTCHLNQPTHAGRINSSHARNSVSCVACHSIHKNGPNNWWPAAGRGERAVRRLPRGRLGEFPAPL